MKYFHILISIVFILFQNVFTKEFCENKYNDCKRVREEFKKENTDAKVTLCYKTTDHKFCFRQKWPKKVKKK